MRVYPLGASRGTLGRTCLLEGREDTQHSTGADPQHPQVARRGVVRSLRERGVLPRGSLLGTGVKTALAAAHFHDFGVALQQGPWNTRVNKGKRRDQSIAPWPAPCNSLM
jgi:hypothetical protein